MPEVTIKDTFGRAIYKTISKYNINTVLEIGAFNGDGSTQVIARALKRKHTRVSLTSLEYDNERFRELVRNTCNYGFVKTINQSSIGKDSYTQWDFDKDVWESPFNGLKGTFSKEKVKKWHDNDITNIRQVQSGFLENTKESWDAVLIDGGEFSGYDEYRLVVERTNCIMLDDAFHAYKTFRARVELLKNPNWKLEWQDSKVRNGAAIFVRINLKKELLLKRISRYIYKH